MKDTDDNEDDEDNMGEESDDDEFLDVDGNEVGQQNYQRSQDRKLEQNVTSNFSPGWYYFFTLPADFLQWSIFLPFVCFYVHSHFDRSAQSSPSCDDATVCGEALLEAARMLESQLDRCSI